STIPHPPFLPPSPYRPLSRSLVVRRDEPRGTRARRLFRLSPRGERALRAWLARRPGWPPPLREEIFVRFLAAGRHGVDAVRLQRSEEHTSELQSLTNLGCRLP